MQYIPCSNQHVTTVDRQLDGDDLSTASSNTKLTGITESYDILRCCFKYRGYIPPNEVEK